MKNKFGILCMGLGLLLLAASAGLLVYNRAENDRAGDSATEIVEQLESVPTASALPDLNDLKMTEVEIDGNLYIGYLEIPALDLKLPVMSDWSYSKLQIAPCRDYGSVYTDDLVVMAHNYEKHFGRIKNLVSGDTVLFTDMDNTVWEYEVVTQEILAPEQGAEMKSGEYDLTMYTCTYGGKNRVTVRCNRAA